MASQVLLASRRLRKPFAGGAADAGVFRFAVFVACALDRAAMTAASALLSSAGLLAFDGARS